MISSSVRIKDKIAFTFTWLKMQNVLMIVQYSRIQNISGALPAIRTRHIAQLLLKSGFIQVRENWKRSGNLSGQGKSGKMQK